ncbi:hypothetical protein [Micromonospora sp. NPDC050200]
MLDQEIQELFACGDRLAGGRIVQFWGEQDLYGLLRGLEMLPDGPIEF